MTVAIEVQPFEGAWVAAACLYGDNNRLIEALPLVRLLSHERDLQVGRFVWFDAAPQATVIVLPKLGYASTHERLQKLDRMMDWIAAVNEAPWCFAVSEDEVTFGFSFADATVAIMFALVWS